MILVTEMVGDLHQLMTIGVVSLIAYLVMDFMGGEPVYEDVYKRQTWDFLISNLSKIYFLSARPTTS